MKTILLILLLLGTQSIFSQIETDTIIITSEYKLSKKKPLIANKNTLIISKIDSLHLVNNSRFTFYENLRTLVNSNIDKDIEKMVFQYENQLNENNELFTQLEEKSKSQAKLYQKTIDELQTSLKKANSDLNLSQKSLTKANTSIDTGLDQISKSKKKRFWKSMGLVGGGVTFGLLTGLILAK